MTGLALEVRELRRRFGSHEVVAGASFGVAPGEWASLVGPSGWGKTTLLQMVGLLDRPTG